MLKDFLRILVENFPIELENILTSVVENKNSNIFLKNDGLVPHCKDPTVANVERFSSNSCRKFSNRIKEYSNFHH